MILWLLISHAEISTESNHYRRWATSGNYVTYLDLWEMPPIFCVFSILNLPRVTSVFFDRPNVARRLSPALCSIIPFIFMSQCWFLTVYPPFEKSHRMWSHMYRGWTIVPSRVTGKRRTHRRTVSVPQTSMSTASSFWTELPGFLHATRICFELLGYL